jgi:hypothetical protein
MQKGIELLRTDRRLRTAFSLAKEAMYSQQAHYELATNGRREWETKDGTLRLAARYRALDYQSKAASWRPFQLAFLLMNLESISRPDSEERSIVDLIWFPTGGDKTEAYLGLSAVAIFLRRLSKRVDGETSILMRYTLRLLTTPNDHQDAVSSLNRLYQSPNENKFIVLTCPWCGAAMGPVRAGNAWRIKGYIKVPRPSRVVFRCEDPDCPFSTEEACPHSRG